MAVVEPSTAAIKMRAHDLTVRYGAKEAITSVTLDVRANEILALIGPSGCGKSTFLRSLNRMNDTIEGVTIQNPRTWRQADNSRVTYLARDVHQQDPGFNF